jgi:hypothetical protein
MAARLIGICVAGLALLGGVAVADPAPTPPAKKVIIAPTGKEPVCRRAAPTGSRIAQQRCTTPGAGTELNSAQREQLQRDIDEVRTRGAMRDQARAAAELDAARMRAGL